MMLEWLRSHIKAVLGIKTAFEVPMELRDDIRRIFPLANFPNADPKMVLFRINKASHEVVHQGDKLANELEFKDVVITPPLCIYFFCEMCRENGINPRYPNFTQDELQVVFRIKQQLSEFAVQDKEFRHEILSRLDAFRLHLKKDGRMVDASRAALLQSILLCDQRSWNSFSLIYELVTRSITTGITVKLNHENALKTYGREMKFRLFDMNDLKALALPEVEALSA